MLDFVPLEVVLTEGCAASEITSPVTLRERRPAASRPAGEGSATQDAKRSTSQLFRERKLVLVIANYFASRIARTKIAASSGRVNSGGGASPARSISRTFVPDSIKRSASVCGQVLNDAIELHRLQ